MENGKLLYGTPEVNCEDVAACSGHGFNFATGMSEILAKAVMGKLGQMKFYPLEDQGFFKG